MPSNTYKLLFHEICEQKKLKQEAMAFELDISQSKYCKLENNNRGLTLDEAFSICEKLKIKLPELVESKYLDRVEKPFLYTESHVEFLKSNCEFMQQELRIMRAELDCYKRKLDNAQNQIRDITARKLNIV